MNNHDNQLPAITIIGITGGSGAGKSHLSKKLQEMFPDEVAVIPCDAFFRSLGPEDAARMDRGEHNLDDPDAIEFELLVKVVRDLKEGREEVEVPVYDFAAHVRKRDVQKIASKALVVVEGIFVLNNPELAKLMDVKFFVDCDADVRLGRRIARDVVERGRTLQGVVDQYFRFVKPCFDRFIEPVKAQADVVLDGGKDENEFLVTNSKANVRSSDFSTLISLAKRPTRFP